MTDTELIRDETLKRARDDADRALRCLWLEVAGTIAEDVAAKVANAFNQYEAAIQSVKHRYTSLASALEAKQADTERLDWLEQHSGIVSVFDPPSGDAWVWCVGAYSDVAARLPEDVQHDIEGQGDTLREAIDSAMKGGVFPPSDSISVPGND